MIIYNAVLMFGSILFIFQIKKANTDIDDLFFVIQIHLIKIMIIVKEWLVYN